MIIMSKKHCYANGGYLMDFRASPEDQNSPTNELSITEIK